MILHVMYNTPINYEYVFGKEKTSSIKNWHLHSFLRLSVISFMDFNTRKICLSALRGIETDE